MECGAPVGRGAVVDPPGGREVEGAEYHGLRSGWEVCRHRPLALGVDRHPKASETVVRDEVDGLAVAAAAVGVQDPRDEEGGQAEEAAAEVDGAGRRDVVVVDSGKTAECGAGTCEGGARGAGEGKCDYRGCGSHDGSGFRDVATRGEGICPGNEAFPAFRASDALDAWGASTTAPFHGQALRAYPHRRQRRRIRTWQHRSLSRQSSPRGTLNRGTRRHHLALTTHTLQQGDAPVEKSYPQALPSAQARTPAQQARSQAQH